MMPYFCNPIDCVYRYQFIPNPHTGKISINREAADPSVILFQGKYYLFASMTLSVWVSDDLCHWESHRLPEELPLYGYAPDACVAGEWVYFTASHLAGKCVFYRTKDILNGPYERIDTHMCYHDPHLFYDDGRFFFYWGCSDTEPIRGVELNEALEPMGESVSLIHSAPYENGYERIGEDNSKLPLSDSEIDAILKKQGIEKEKTDPAFFKIASSVVGQKPYMEGPWMTKYRGRYYLQYAFGGAQYNIYGDGVYVADAPLGPFHLAKNNPYAYQTGGFLPGAGHGCTFQDRSGNYWHAGTMRISVNHNFERRVGIWKAGFDQDGELFCNTAYGDWPQKISEGVQDPWKKPEWYLLSYRKPATASSGVPIYAVDENVQSVWQAESNGKDEWLQIDLGQVYDVKAVQVNFADASITLPEMPAIAGDRYIEPRELSTRYLLTGSIDGEQWHILADRTQARSDRSHETHFIDASLRYIRISQMELPYGQAPCISGLRVFGVGDGDAPSVPTYQAWAEGNDLHICVETDAVGYHISWGYAPDKLYHSAMAYTKERRIGGLVRGQPCYVRVDAFNESGITEGVVKQVSRENKSD